jgi:hypothetical protein
MHKGPAVKIKKLSVHTAVHRAVMPNAATDLIGAAVPLYLTYQSLIC